jgi:tRNA (mo5U34)-methyltransferase
MLRGRWRKSKAQESKLQKSKEQVRREVRALGWWYQCFELPSGVMTSSGSPSAYYPEAAWELFQKYLPEDLSGKSVLDVGGNAGYFSVQMMHRGAERCTLIEPFTEFAAQARYVAGEFGYPIKVVEEDVHTYCLSTDERFDYVMFLGLFYHLKYPVIVLDRLAEMTTERMVFQSHAIGHDQLDYEGHADYGVGASDLVEDRAFPRLLFIERLYNRDPTNWWIPNASALEPLVRSAGMRVVARPNAEMLVAEPEQPFGKVVLDRKLVFPKYGKPGGGVHPGPQRVDPQLWEELLREAEEPGA